MQPCSQPLYGFRLVSNPTSGLLLRVMIDLVSSRKYCVSRRGRSSVSTSGSTTSGSLRSTCSFSKRLAGLQEAPRPWIAARLWAVSLTTGRNFAPIEQVHMNILGCRVAFLTNTVKTCPHSASKCAHRLAHALGDGTL